MLEKRFILAPICALFLALSLAPVRAEDTLSLSLETPGLEDRASDQQSASASDTTNRNTYNTTAHVRNASANENPVGRLGSVVASKASIYSQRSTKSKVFASCQKDTPLAIVGEISDWYGVLMIDGSTGWIQRKYVQLLDYALVRERASAARTKALSSRGNYDRSDDMSLPTNASANDVVQEAFRYMGVPYVWGGTSDYGMDCSGFLQKIHAHCGVRLPRTAREQANVGAFVPVDQLQPGDRLYFSCKHSYVDHCGMYIGNGLFIHSSAGRGGVAVDKIAKPFWAQTLVVARR